MAGTFDASALKDALVVLGTAAVVVPLVRRLHVNSVIGFLAAGAVMGPSGLGALSSRFPLIDWVTIGERDRIAEIAELGVVFLLFVIGLELSLARLKTMRRLVFGLGALQVVVSTLAIALIARLVLPATAALVLASGLALSSTAIVVEILAAKRRMASATGRANFAVLIFQDLAVVPVLFLVGTLGVPGGGGPSMWTGLAYALLSAAVTIGAIVAAGNFLLRPLFRLVARPENPELFIAATLFVAIGTGVAAAAAGLSMALGAFIAGLLLAETEYRRAIEATIEPFKSLLLGVFFFAIGMTIDIAVVLQHPLLIAGAVLALILVKAGIVFALCRLFRLPTAVSVETAFLLASAGEFAFVVFNLASSLAIFTPEQSSLAVVVTSLSMALIPMLGWSGRRLAKRLERTLPVEAAALEPPPEDRQRRAIIVGYGRVGRLVAEMLAEHRIPYLAVDADARGVAKWREDGKPVYWGDATNAVFLERCGLLEASALVVTIDTPRQIEAVVTAARALRPDLVIVARSRDAAHASKLYALGVTDAVPETIEASLQLSEAALAGLGVPAGPVIASIHERRDLFRRELQSAAGRPTHAVMPKRTTRRGL
ncbi:cation:proton antiporter domain-containing protein [Labrys monachus]|uniref:CPA2 family monovalent cation:H+ antiporter-2 n=1 Tax=Labrys monachus TaxID=217067 RepID=A0ABU0FLZ0_9HYPH|nr:cation:proton antiporter [Labrys monachus]MDQ0395619.1 CPA2 family monovalent cation:H+ antiporter-2 [Labrys monachus]